MSLGNGSRTEEIYYLGKQRCAQCIVTVALYFFADVPNRSHKSVIFLSSLSRVLSTNGGISGKDILPFKN